jgi:hypothetical protein
MRPSDSILLESEQVTEVLLEPLSGELMARLRLAGTRPRSTASRPGSP